MRYLGFKTDRDIVSQFYDIRTLPLSEDMTEEDLHNLVAVDTIKDKDLVLAKAFEQLNMGVVRQLLQFGIKEIDVIDQSEDDVLIKTLKKDPAHDEESALNEIYKRLRPGDPATAAQAAPCSRGSLTIPRNTTSPAWAATRSTRSSVWTPAWTSA